MEVDSRRMDKPYKINPPTPAHLITSYSPFNLKDVSYETAIIIQVITHYIGLQSKELLQTHRAAAQNHE